MWPGVCQSCVITILAKAGASLLITGTISVPPLTGRVPPSTKQFCTSVTISALLASGLILSAAKELRVARSAALEVRKTLRDRPMVMDCMDDSPVWCRKVYCNRLPIALAVGGASGQPIGRLGDRPPRHPGEPVLDQPGRTAAALASSPVLDPAGDLRPGAAPDAAFRPRPAQRARPRAHPVGGRLGGFAGVVRRL